MDEWGDDILGLVSEGVCWGVVSVDCDVGDSHVPSYSHLCLNCSHLNIHQLYLLHLIPLCFHPMQLGNVVNR